MPLSVSTKFRRFRRTTFSSSSSYDYSAPPNILLKPFNPKDSILYPLCEDNKYEEVKRVHCHTKASNFVPGVFISNRFLNLFSQCGTLVDAQKLFDEMCNMDLCFLKVGWLQHAMKLFDEIPQRDNNFSWNAAISGYGYVSRDLPRHALELFRMMQKHESLNLNKFTLSSALAAIPGKEIHGYLMRTGLDSDEMVWSALLDLCGKCGNLDEAKGIFDQMVERDVVSWTTMTHRCFEDGRREEGFCFFRDLMGSGVRPNECTFAGVQKLIPKSWKQPTKQFDEPFVSSDASMVGVLIASLKDFVSHGRLSNAFKTFFHIQHHAASSGSFNLVLGPISSLLLACINLKSLPQGKQLHSQIISLGLDQNPILVTRLTNFYANVNLLADAHIVTENSNSFDPLPWNILISSYVRNGLFVEALSAYKKMLSKQVQPDDFTYPSVLKACGELLDCTTGLEVHKSIEASSMEWSLFVHNALVSMYGRFGQLEVAHWLFDNMPTRDAVSWNTIISNYASRGMWEEAFQLFRSMQEEGIEINIIILNTIAGGCLRSANFRGALQLLSQMRTSIHLDSVAMIIGLNACSHIGALKLGKEIHGHAVRTCFDVFDNLKNALITMYSRCKDLKHAYMVFHEMKEKGLITWNAILSGYAHMDRSEEVFFLFREMLCKGVVPNYVTIASILPLCARIANLQHGKEFHCYIMKREEFKDYLLLWNALVDMYSRSGKVLEARRVFDSLSTRDEVTYTSMIMGYGMKGDGEIALKLFEEMCEFKIKPDHVTMVAVLTACSHSGIVAQGQLLFKKMVDVYGIIPRIEHYACMADLFGRAGLLNKAKEVIAGMPYKPTSAMWATLIGACRIHGNTVMGEWAAGKLLEMKPDHSGYYVLIANMYAAAGCWSKLAHVRTYMRNLGVRKAPGCAWVNVGNEFSPFLVGDTSNPHTCEIYPLMDGLNELMKDAGYIRSEEIISSEEDFEELNVVGDLLN